MARLTDEQRQAKVLRIEAIRRQVAKLEDEGEVLRNELLADLGVGNVREVGPLSYEFKPIINWRSFDSEAAGVMFPVEDFPQIYAPTYKGTKALLEQLDSGVSMDTFCDTTPRLYIHHKSATRSRAFRGKKKR